MTLHARHPGRAAVEQRKTDLACWEVPLLHHPLAHPLAKQVHAARSGFGQRAAHGARRQLHVALLPLGSRSAVQVEVVEHVHLDWRATHPICRFGLTHESRPCRYCTGSPWCRTIVEVGLRAAIACCVAATVLAACAMTPGTARLGERPTSERNSMNLQ